MKLNNKLKLTTSLLFLAIFTQLGVAYGSWVVLNPDFQAVLNKISINTGEFINGIPGISITNVTQLKLGTYLYNDETGKSSLTGDLIYTFNINANELDSSLKIDNGSGGYEFTLKGSLSINDEEIFTDNTYLDSVYLEDNLISPTYNVTNISFSVNFNTQSNATNTFKLKFTFNNKLILSYKESIINNSFKLTLVKE